MRTLSAKLTAGQKAASIDALWKVVLTKSGQATRTYELDRVLDIDDPEQPTSRKAVVMLDNSDGALTSLSLQGYKAVISYGAVTSDGDEYSSTAPLWVVGQEFDSMEGRLVCVLQLWSIPDLLAEDRARTPYLPDDTDTKTVKTIIQDMFDGTMPAFDACPNYTVTFDSEDALIDVYIPKDSFRVYVNSTRMAAFRKLIDWTGCVVRYEDDGEIHIFVPTTTGTTYDYDYSLATGHTFFSEAYRNRLVIPNKIVVESEPDAASPFTGNAADSASYTALGFYITQYEQTYLASDAQGTAVATAILLKYQINAERGKAVVPMNVGAELFDYVNVVDARQSTERAGNIGSIRRRVSTLKSPTTWTMTFSFGGWLTAREQMANLEILSSGFGSMGQDLGRMEVKNLYAENIQADNINFSLFDLDDLPDGSSYARVLGAHLDTGKIQLIAATVVDDAFTTDKIGEGVTNEYFSGKTLDDLVDGASYSKVLATDITAGHVLLSEVIQSSSYRTVTDTEKGVWTGKPDDMDEIGDGSTYSKVLATDISSGHINLTSAFLIDGVAQATAGVYIDATNGITIKGGKLKFQSSDEVESAVIYLENIGAGASSLHLEAAGWVKTQSLAPDINYSAPATGRFMGASNLVWYAGYFAHLYATADLTVDSLLDSGGGSIDIASNLLPATTDTYNIGSTAKIVKFAYIKAVYLRDASGSVGALVGSGSTVYLSGVTNVDINIQSYGTGDIDIVPARNLAFFGVAGQTRQAHIVDANGTLADITTKFNTLLADLEGYGLLNTA